MPPIFTCTPFVNSGEVFTRDEPMCTATHLAFDIFSSVEASFRAVCSGVFTKEKLYNTGNRKWQVCSWIHFNSSYKANYNFEPFGADDDPGPVDIQYDMLIADGTTVEAGDTLGKLYSTGLAVPHVDFGLYPRSCPMNSFTASVSAEMLALYWRDHPGKQICYDHYFSP